MGMYDRVWVNCPHCGAKVEMQSKQDECTLANFTLADAPLAVLIDVMDWPEHCEMCGGWFAIVDSRHPAVKDRPPTEIRKVRPPDDPGKNGDFQWWPHGKPFGPDDLL